MPVVSIGTFSLILGCILHRGLVNTTKNSLVLKSATKKLVVKKRLGTALFKTERGAAEEISGF